MDWLTVIRTAFDAMKNSGPSTLPRRLAFEAENNNVKGSATAVLLKALDDKDSHIREELHNRLAEWDFEGRPSWTNTERNTRERRDEIYRKLELPDELARAIDKSLPPKTTDVERDMVITEHDAENWYTTEFKRDREFYWPAFRGYLKEKKGWSEETLNGFSESANRIVENLAPPHSEIPMPRRGLVVGYVQSGKTTNFTAVVAKAIDAGYRLVIIFAGTLDILRRQTQRRLDMELVGRENLNILDEDETEREYASDKDYPDKFLCLGAVPRQVGRPNIKRLTTSTGDFRSIAHSFQALAFDELGGLEKAYTLDNIKKTNVRFFVIKKTVRRLEELVRELKHNKKVCEHLPALVIDDESDQASVNTTDLADNKERSATNELIVRILGLLPRAQYVGYTATPFANVLVDPGSEEDIFPRDFIISLPRPAGYMGVADFNDMDAGEGDPTPNKDAHVRQFEANDDASLDQAMDAFVVSGALKLFRESRGGKGDFKHHTMMIHEQVRNSEQAARKLEVLKKWKAAGYGSPGPGTTRLRNCLENEFRPTWQRLNKELPFPRDFNELMPFVGKALKRIGATDPIIVVNGAKGGVDPEFDKAPVWKIIIGGAKLSRGFTVEGLTITYFGRRAGQQDTLMQMGRWFGYRTGYRDLVRLYLQRADGTKYDLYEAFEALCRDEEAFRTQLARYLRPGPGQRAIRPIEVPAVVFNSYPRLAPTSPNKMFSAVMVQDFLSDGWRFPTDVSLAREDVASNWRLLEKTVQRGLKTVELDGKIYLAVDLSRAESAKFLDSIVWKDRAPRLKAEREFFRNSAAAVDNWTLLLPQLQAREEMLGAVPVSVHRRSELADETFKAFTDPADVKRVANASRSEKGVLNGRAVILVYPSRVKQDERRTAEPILGLAIYHPPIPRDAQVAQFTVRSSSITLPKRA